jgi:hypothetical protein
MPPPLTPEQFFQLQMQMMALQQIHAQPPPPPPPQPRDRRADFLRGHPPTFSHATDPLQADDWLRSVERQLVVAQCDDWERVLYAAGQLRGSLSTGGRPTQLGTVMLSRGTSSASASGTTTFLRAS